MVSSREKVRFLEILVETGFECGGLSLDETENTASVEQLESLFKLRSADYWEELLAPEGIGCVRADGSTSAR